MSSTPIKIWVVDDDTNEQVLLTHAFKKVNFPNEVCFLRTAVAAMRALESATQDELPHLILCDVKMPGVDGFEFVQWLRASPWKAMPVALFSNSNIQADIDRSYDLGANAFHVKSPTNEKLLHCLETIVRFWGDTARLPSLGTARRQLPH